MNPVDKFGLYIFYDGRHCIVIFGNVLHLIWGKHGFTLSYACSLSEIVNHSIWHFSRLLLRIPIYWRAVVYLLSLMRGLVFDPEQRRHPRVLSTLSTLKILHHLFIFTWRCSTLRLPQADFEVLDFLLSKSRASESTLNFSIFSVPEYGGLVRTIECLLGLVLGPSLRGRFHTLYYDTVTWVIYIT
jgi:hypothetical protein